VGVDLGDQWIHYCILGLEGGNAGGCSTRDSLTPFLMSVLAKELGMGGVDLIDCSSGGLIARCKNSGRPGIRTLLCSQITTAPSTVVLIALFPSGFNPYRPRPQPFWLIRRRSRYWGEWKICRCVIRWLNQIRLS
jgi:hypothetical protein